MLNDVTARKKDEEMLHFLPAEELALQLAQRGRTAA
jgi:hypothetical protein